jgi:hypothetical protein
MSKANQDLAEVLSRYVLLNSSNCFFFVLYITQFIVFQDCTDHAAEQLTQPIFKNDTYDNPWPTWSLLSFGKFFKWRLFESVNNTNLPSDRKVSK